MDSLEGEGEEGQGSQVRVDRHQAGRTLQGLVLHHGTWDGLEQ